MSFNNKPYKKITLNNKEYYKITVDGKTVWRKPLNYLKSLKILDIDSGVVRSENAETDGALSCSIKRLEGESWMDILPPSQNNTTSMGSETPIILDNQKVLKYEDNLSIVVTLNDQYTIEESTFEMGGSDIEDISDFNLTGDMNIEIAVVPKSYTVTITKSSEILDVYITILPGKIATIQQKTPSRVYTGDRIFYGDYLLSLGLSVKDGYALNTEDSVLPFGEITGDTSFNLVSKPVSSVLQISTPTYGLESYSVYRTAGEIATSLGVTSGVVDNGAVLYTGDALTVTKTAETGYSVEVSAIPELTSTYLKNNPTVFVTFTSRAIDHSIRTVLSGDLYYSGAIRNLSVRVIPGEISNRLGTTQEYLAYSGEYKDTTLFYAHYGDTVRFIYSTIPGYTISPQDDVSYNRDVVVRGSVVLQVYLSVIAYSLTFNESTHISRISRTSSPYKGRPVEELTSGDPIYYGDSISLVIEEIEGYNVTISGTKWSTNPEEGVYFYNNLVSNVSIQVNASVKTLSYNISTDSGIGSLTVKRVHRYYPEESSEEVVIPASSTCNYKDTISYDPFVKTGYALDSTPTPVEITEDTTINVTSHLMYGTLEIVKNEGVRSITVTRNGKNLPSGSTLRWGDYLNISAEAITGYVLDIYIAGDAFLPHADGDIYTVSITAEAIRMNLNIISGTGVASYSATRLYSPIGGQTGSIDTGDIVYYGDIIRVTYSSEEGYVVGSAYSTTDTISVTCLTTQSEWDINLTATKLVSFWLNQSSVRGTDLDDTDCINVKINYPDNPSQAISYNENKKVRADQSILIYSSNQQFKEGLPYLTKIRVSLEHTTSQSVFLDYVDVTPTVLEGQEVFIIDMTYSGNIIRGITLIFEPLNVYLDTRLKANRVLYVKPEEAQVTLLVTHKYATGVQETHSFSLKDYYLDTQEAEETIEVYYKDSIKVTYTDVKGWTFDVTEVYTNSGLNPDELINGGTFVIDHPENFLIEILRNIVSRLQLTFYNKYGVYSRGLINGELQIEDWKSYSGETSRTFYVDYGSSFFIIATAPADNFPMRTEYSSHDNSTTYYVTDVDNPTEVIKRFSLKLYAPVLTTSCSVEEDDLKVSLSINNPNSGCTAHILITTDNSNTTEANRLLYEGDVYISGNTYSNEFNFTAYQKYYDITYNVTISVYNLGRTIGEINRTNSDTSSVSHSILVPGYAD